MPATSETPKTHPLGRRLLDAGLLTEDQLDLALRERQRLGGYLGEALENLGFISQEALTTFLAQNTQCRVVDVSNWFTLPEVLQLISYDTAKRFELLPLERNGHILTIALADTYNVVAVDTVERLTGLTVEVVTAPPRSILEAIERQYARSGSINETIDEILQQGEATFSEEAGGEAPMIRLCNQILTLAVHNRVTDVHVEPEEKIVRIRMRVDGVLRQEVLMPKALQAALTARYKLMAMLNVTEKRLPQDGRIPFSVGSRQVDLRVSTMPTNFGESIVLRVLDKSSVHLEFTALGFSARDEQMVKAFIERPHGIILVTGPTGSGKTTTLYTALSTINAQEKSVFTLEDPIEYQMPMIRQTQVNPDIGMTFPIGLRALLRQDPDVILVGEIRDKETADLAFRAALTGHLVFSTLHTNDAIGAISRLIDMGVESFLLSSALIAVIGQRLVRQICPACKREQDDPVSLLQRFHIEVSETDPLHLWKGEGCSSCSETGYRGRLGIYEILPVNEQLHDLIVKGPDIPGIRLLAGRMGMRTMFQDGINKALLGKTALEEVSRVTSD